MSRLSEMIKKLCPNGVEYRPLWSVTIWDKKFNAVDRAKQPKVIKYNYFLANDLKPLIVKGGSVKLLTTNTTNLYTTEELAGDLISEGEVVTIPWGGNPNIQYYKGKFLTADNRIATSKDTSVLDNKYLFYFMQSRREEIGSFYRGSGIKGNASVLSVNSRRFIVCSRLTCTCSSSFPIHRSSPRRWR